MTYRPHRVGRRLVELEDLVRGGSAETGAAHQHEPQHSVTKSSSIGKHFIETQISLSYYSFVHSGTTKLTSSSENITGQTRIDFFQFTIIVKKNLNATQRDDFVSLDT